MLSITSDNIDDLYKRCLHRILTYGQDTKPRGFNCKELSPCSVTLTLPQMNVLVNPLRKASQAFMAAELLWILTKRDDVEMISFYNSNIAKYSDNGKTFFGAYGPKVMNQFSYVLDVLQKDPWTRQAVISIWQENPPVTKDVPCTISLHFLQRPLGTLNLVAYMRSQDVWLGFPYDVHNFTSLQSLIASMLKCKLGTFTLVQGSLHMYESNFVAAQDVMKWDGRGPRIFTPNSNTASLEDLKNRLAVINYQEQAIRTNTAPGPYLNDDPLLGQKILWLETFAKKKYAVHRD
jgi:thymidylate synthase